MSDGRATWELVLGAARGLGARGRSFRLSELVAEVHRVDPTRGRGSIQPVVQGMTANAGKGPPSPCGKVLHRVDHGYYALRDAHAAGTRSAGWRACPGADPATRRATSSARAGAAC